MDFSTIVQERYAAKKFTGERVDEATIDELLKLIAYAPSSLGLQSYKVIVVRDQALKEALFPSSRQQAQITTCSHLLIFCADTDIETHIEAYLAVMKAQGEEEERITRRRALIQSYIDRKHDRLIWSQKQCYIALGNALNGAQSLGLDSCPMEAFDPEAYKDILALPKNLYPTVLAAIGRAADTKRAKIRLPANLLFEKRN